MRLHIVVSVDEMSLPGGGDAVLSVVDGLVYDVSSVMKAGELDVCGYDSVMSDKAGD